MSKKILLAFLMIIVVGIGVGAGFFYFNNQKTAENETEWWKDENKVFSVKVPDDFDSFRLERVKEKRDQSLELYRKDKNDTWTWLVIANYYEYIHEYDRSEKAYQRVLSLKDNEVMALSNLAALYEYNLKDYVKAEAYYKRYLATNFLNPIAYINLGLLYTNKMNRIDDAEQIFLEGLDKTSNNSDILVFTIRFYKKINRLEDAKKYAKILIEKYPEEEVYKKDFGDLIK